MTRITRTAAKGAFGAMVLAALGLGATQALAAPAPSDATTVRGCNALQCLDECGPEWLCIDGRCHCGG